MKSFIAINFFPNALNAKAALFLVLFLCFAVSGEEFTDPRDGLKYPVKKMADGSVWFMQDLGGDGKKYSWKHASSIGTCPTGWHLPTNVEWNRLNNIIKKDSRIIEEFSGSGTSNHWWSSSEYSIYYSWLWYVSGDKLDSVYNDKMDAYPIRCVKNIQ